MFPVPLIPFSMSSERVAKPSEGLSPKKDPSLSQEDPEKSGEEKSEKGTEIRVDGGLVAWLQVLGAFCLSFTTWSIHNSALIRCLDR